MKLTSFDLDHTSVPPMTTPQTCKFCNEPAANTLLDTDPPMCERHLDLLITVEFIIGQNQDPTVDRVLTLLDRARKRGGKLTITDNEVPAMLPDVFKALRLQER